LKVVVKGKIEPSVLVRFDAGLRDNMVPDHALAVVSDITLKSKFENFLQNRGLVGQATQSDALLVLEVDGKSAHGSTPDEGVNAAYLMVHFFNEVGINNAFVDAINTYLLDDTKGVKIGVDYLDKEMGPVTVNAGVFKLDNHAFEITLNPRYPNGVDPERFIKRFETAFESLGLKVELGKHQRLLYVDPKSEMIQTLMTAYKKYSNDHDAKPLTTGGGTFARTMKNSVAFGPHFPNKPSYIHQKDEYIILDDFFMSIAIYADALYQLAK
jgi:succinyl-diaminopimelate desuccinylase